jgi:hypothetical protein
MRQETVLGHLAPFRVAQNQRRLRNACYLRRSHDGAIAIRSIWAIVPIETSLWSGAVRRPGLGARSMKNKTLLLSPLALLPMGVQSAAAAPPPPHPVAVTYPAVLGGLLRRCQSGRHQRPLRPECLQPESGFSRKLLLRRPRLLELFPNGLRRPRRRTDRLQLSKCELGLRYRGGLRFLECA